MTPRACDGKRADVPDAAQVEWWDVVECYLARELNHARQALQAAYEQARAISYRPGSLEMHKLQGAEEHYQQEQQRWRRYVGQPAAAEQHISDTTTPGYDVADR